MAPSLGSTSVRIGIDQESEAIAGTKELYEEIRDFFGFPAVPDVFKLTSTRPDFLRVMFEGYKAMFGGGHLPRQVKEMIATVVSRTNSCAY